MIASLFNASSMAKRSTAVSFGTAIEENAAHEIGCNRKEMGTALPRDVFGID